MRHCHGTADDTWRLPLLFCCNVTNKISSKDGSTRSGHSRTTFIAALYYLYSETTCFSSGVERRGKALQIPQCIFFVSSPPLATIYLGFAFPVLLFCVLASWKNEQSQLGNGRCSTPQQLKQAPVVSKPSMLGRPLKYG